MTQNDSNLKMLLRDLAPFRDKPIGSVRIDMNDVRSILNLADSLTAEPSEEVIEKVAYDIYNASFHPSDYGSKQVNELYARESEKRPAITKAKAAIKAFQKACK